MDTIVFFGVIAVIVIITAISSVNANKNKINQLRESFLSSFGKKSYNKKEDIDIRNESDFFNHMRDEEFRKKLTGYGKYFEVDDITFSDLELEELLCRMDTCVSSIGSEVLREKVRHINMEDDSAEDFIKLSNEACKNNETMLKIMLSLSQIGRIKSSSVFNVLGGLQSCESSSNVKYIVIDIIFVLSILSIALSPGFGVIFLIIMMGICISTHFKNKGKMDNSLKGYNFLIKMLKSGRNILDLVDKKELSVNDYLKDSLDISKKLSSLEKGTFLFPKGAHTSTNPVDILLDYIRMIFSFDIILFNYRIDKIKNNLIDILKLYYVIGLIDAAICIASYRKYLGITTDVNCCNDMDSSEFIMEFKGLYHPFIDNPVTNDVTISRNILLTGSNASGKSTFLKACGVNVILMQTLGFAAMESYSAPKMRIFTSMALRDNLLGNESYYIVEAKSLKRLLDAAKEDGYALTIVDEVLKGTNTIERIAASYSILKSFKQDNVIMLAATHDIELTRMLEEEYSSYYFTEEVSKESVTFPYKINKGFCYNKNAIRLLDMLGYDKDIISDAKEKADRFEKEGTWED